MNDLEQLINAPQVLDIAGRRVEVSPLRVRELPAFLAAVKPIAAELSAGVELVDLLADQAEAIIAAVAIGARVERAWLDELLPDDLVALAGAVLEVNADFFARRVLPAMTERMTGLAASLAGRTSSSASSATATDSAT